MSVEDEMAQFAPISGTTRAHDAAQASPTRRRPDPLGAIVAALGTTAAIVVAAGLSGVDDVRTPSSADLDLDPATVGLVQGVDEVDRRRREALSDRVDPPARDRGKTRGRSAGRLAPEVGGRGPQQPPRTQPGRTPRPAAPAPTGTGPVVPAPATGVGGGTGLEPGAGPGGGVIPLLPLPPVAVQPVPGVGVELGPTDDGQGAEVELGPAKIDSTGIVPLSAVL